MAKPFASYNEQIRKLQIEKQLTIENTNFAMESLQNISYYGLIGGYKHPFIDTKTRKYIGNTRFEDIVGLYYFDEALRCLFFKYLCRVERRIRSLMSYHFTERHGEQQMSYLNSSNYTNAAEYATDIAKLIRMLSNMVNNRDHEYIIYQRNKYHNVPLWVLMNALTFGQISKMFQFSPQNMQGQICRNIEYVKKNEMINYLKVLTLFRNVCAHSERLFSYRTHIDIPDTMIHKKLCIPKNGTKYSKGKNDLFIVVIAFLYLLPKLDFTMFKRELFLLLSEYEKGNSPLSTTILYGDMGFPENWEDITKF